MKLQQISGLACAMLILALSACSGTDPEGGAPGPDSTTSSSDMAGMVVMDSGTDPLNDMGEPGIECQGCEGLQTCDSRTGECQEPEVCQRDIDCLADRVCESGACSPGCADSGCANQLVCGDQGRCHEASPCESNGGCLGERLCVEGTCTERCTEDAGCSGRQICNLDSGQCELPDECRTDEDCGAQAACIDGECHGGCSDAAPCPGTQECQDGQCVEPGSCIRDNDCLGGRLCAFGQCQDRCLEDADCPMARVCDLETGRCPEPNRCDIDDECDPDRVCITHLCHDPCVAGGCPGNQACENFRCEEPAQCADDVDCIGVRICSRNRCDAPCQENADCLGADVCDVPSGHCVELHPECAIEEDCPADHACILGACRQGVCQVHLNCAENEDCIDGACAPALRPNCRDRDDCPAGQTCASFGACVAANPCQNDGQCLGARNVCWLGRCAACRVDSDCTASEACDQGRCVSHGFCAADADCPGDTTACANARCTPAPCEGDNLDFQLGTPRVMARTYSDLVLCDGDMDHYSVEVGPGQGLNVSLHHDPGAGDLELVLRSLGEEARGESQNGIARAGILSAGPPRMIDVIITGRAGYRTPYRLDVRPTIEDGCVPDNDEPPLGNDLQGSAMPVGDGSAQVVTRLCEGDLDWLSFIVPGGTTARATLSTDNLAAVEMNLYSDRGALIAEAINDGRNKIVSAEADFRTTFGLKLDLAVGGGSASNTVSFEVEAGANAAAAACMDAGWAAVGEPYWFRPQLSADRFIGACNAPGEFYDRVLRFRVEAAGQYQIDTLGTDRNATIIIRSECPGADAELHCVQGGSLGPVALALGEYYLILDSAASGPQGVLIHPVQ